MPVYLDMSNGILWAGIGDARMDPIPCAALQFETTNRHFNLAVETEGPKPGLKIPKSTPPETVDLVVFDPRFYQDGIQHKNQ